MQFEDYANRFRELYPDASDKEIRSHYTLGDRNIFERLGSSFAREYSRMASSLGTGIKMLGGEELGAQMERYWDQAARNYPQDPQYQGFTQDPSNLIDPAYWAENAGTGLSLAASMFPATAGFKAARMAGLGRTPSMGVGMGASMMGGGHLEGTNTYRQALEQGMSEDEAMDAYWQMALGTGVLNALPVGAMGSKLGTRGARALAAAGGEAVTESLEEPWEASILGEDPWEAWKTEGINVMPIAAVLGGGMSYATDRNILPTKKIQDIIDDNRVPVIYNQKSADDDYVYHVTFTDNVDGIRKEGLKPLQTSNWVKGEGGSRYNAEGGVFAFSDPEDAFKWAFKQEWDFKRPTSIVKMKRGSTWGKDPSQDITLQTGKGQSLRSIAAIKPENVVDVFDYKDFGTPASLGVSQADWFKSARDRMTQPQTPRVFRYNEANPTEEMNLWRSRMMAGQQDWTLDDHYKYAPDNQQEMNGIISGLGIPMHLSTDINPETGKQFDEGSKYGEKTRESSERKLRDKYAGDASRFTDIVRSTITPQTPALADRAVQALSERYTVMDEGWSMTPTGYVDRKLMVLFPNGQMGEIQMMPPALYDAKELKGGHKMYEQWRKKVKDAGLGADQIPKRIFEEEQQRIYNAGRKGAPEFQDVFDRLIMASNSEPDTSVPMDMTSAMSAGSQEPSGRIWTARTDSPASSMAAGLPASDTRLSTGKPSIFMDKTSDAMVAQEDLNSRTVSMMDGLGKRGDQYNGAPEDVKVPADVQAKITNYVELYNRSQPADATWYQRFGQKIAQFYPRDVEMRERLTRVLALLSSDDTVLNNTNSWLNAAHMIAESHATNRDVNKITAEVGRYPSSNATYIRNAMDLGKPFDPTMMGVGHKVWNFYRNLRDGVDGIRRDVETDPVTIDRWMLYALGWPTSKKSAGGKNKTNPLRPPAGYTFAEFVTREAARQAGILPSEMQAAVWSQYRRDAGMVDAEFADAVDLATQNVTAETIPGVVVDMTPQQKQAYTEATWSILHDPMGNNQLATMLGIPMYREQAGTGGYMGQITPNMTFSLLAQKPNGAYDTLKADIFSKAIQYIYTQDGVPYFRADPTMDADPAGTGLGFRFTFPELNGEIEQRFFDQLQVVLGESAGFTRVGNSINVINYEGLNSEFDEIIGDFMESEAAADATVEHFVSEGNYHEQDWQADPEGEALLQEIGRLIENTEGAIRGPAVLERLRGWRAQAQAVGQQFGVGRNQIYHQRSAPQDAYSILPEDQVPLVTRKAYKLMKIMPSRPDMLFPLYAKPEGGPRQGFMMGEWHKAEDQRPTLGNKKLAQRAGIHAMAQPVFDQGKAAAKGEQRVWVEVEMPVITPATQQESDNSPQLANGMREGIKTRLIGPHESYNFKTNPAAEAAGGWPIAGSAKITRVLSDSEVKSIVENAGIEYDAKYSETGISTENAARLNNQLGPYGSTEVTYTAQDEDGNTYTVTENVGEALQEFDRRLAALEEVRIKCL